MRYPRKFKKALKQVKEGPRISDGVVQYGKLIIPKRKTKHILKAIKIKRASEMNKMVNVFTKLLSINFYRNMNNISKVIEEKEYEWDIKLKENGKESRN
ncbi:MAG: hypothetical protein ACRCS6_04420 [Turicibacter sp.]